MCPLVCTRVVRVTDKDYARYASGRDRDNNIIIHWTTIPVDKLPTDNAKCWLYVERLSAWSVD